jgi:quercetin dioxygenase-like cupin family protein
MATSVIVARSMQRWDLPTHPVEAHRPEILQSQQGEGRAILLALPAGERLQEHRVQERAYLVVVTGRVEIASEETIEVGPGGLVVFEPTESHEVSALEDARLLLVLAPWPAPTHRGATR